MMQGYTFYAAGHPRHATQPHPPLPHLIPYQRTPKSYNGQDSISTRLKDQTHFYRSKATSTTTATTTTAKLKPIREVLIQIRPSKPANRNQGRGARWQDGMSAQPKSGFATTERRVRDGNERFWGLNESSDEGWDGEAAAEIDGEWRAE